MIPDEETDPETQKKYDQEMYATVFGGPMSKGGGVQTSFNTTAELERGIRRGQDPETRAKWEQLSPEDKNQMYLIAKNINQSAVATLGFDPHKYIKSYPDEGSTLHGFTMKSSNVQVNPGDPETTLHEALHQGIAKLRSDPDYQTIENKVRESRVDFMTSPWYEEWSKKQDPRVLSRIEDDMNTEHFIVYSMAAKYDQSPPEKIFAADGQYDNVKSLIAEKWRQEPGNDALLNKLEALASEKNPDNHVKRAR